MNIQQRNEIIKTLFAEGSSQSNIARQFNISRQRVHQIAPGYSSPATQKSRKESSELKILTKRKREFLGLSQNDLSQLESSRDKRRELVRIRDGHTCQKCGKLWKIGMRRFDVHHLDENMDGKSRFNGLHKYDIEHMKDLITLCHKCHMGLEETRERMSKRLSPVHTK